MQASSGAGGVGCVGLVDGKEGGGAFGFIGIRVTPCDVIVPAFLHANPCH